MSFRHMGYTRVGKRSKGLRLRRFSVQGLRARFLYLFNQISRWRSSYGRALRSIIKKMGGDILAIRNNSSRSWRSRTNHVPLTNSCSLRSSLGHSNSFYSEAISDCLEFIKRSSVSDDDQKPPVPVTICQT
ncbi:hypothetical protein Gotri_024846 [Gossypium trilobum]|uniref:Uncharacterized protein n=2 Tax=Gossypium TaxID=3633 RepID=A0A7J9FU96_9ROSI|nr:hypothetical protein [Gossypium trilobum]